MKRILLGVSILLSVGLLAGCSDLPQENTAKSNIRFVAANEEYAGGFGIVIDKETGVNYIFYDYGIFDQRCTAMTPLLDKDGKVIINKN